MLLDSQGFGESSPYATIAMMGPRIERTSADRSRGVEPRSERNFARSADLFFVEQKVPFQPVFCWFCLAISASKITVVHDRGSSLRCHALMAMSKTMQTGSSFILGIGSSSSTETFGHRCVTALSRLFLGGIIPMFLIFRNH